MPKRIVTPIPRMAGLSLIGRCNSRCCYCHSWKSTRDGPSTRDWLRVIGQVAEVGASQVSFSGGEPLLRPDLPVLVAEAKRCGMQVQLSTNGLLLTDGLFRQTVAAGLDYATVSLDSLHPQIYTRLRGVPLVKILEGLDAADRLRCQHPSLRVGLKCVVSRANIDGLFDLIELIAERDWYLGFQPLHRQFVGHPQTLSSLGFTGNDRPRLVEVFTEIVERKVQGAAIVNRRDYLAHFPTFLLHGTLPADFSCTAGDDTLNIDDALRLKPCWTFSAVGRVADTPLFELWNSPSMEAARAQMRQNRCAGCWLTCHADLPAAQETVAHDRSGGRLP